MMRTVSVGFQSACAARGAAATAIAPETTARRVSFTVMVVSSQSNFVKDHRESAQSEQARRTHITHAQLFAAKNLEHVGEVGQFLTARRCPAANVVEDFTVLQAIVGNALHATVLVKIDRDHALVDDLLGHE